MVMIEEKLNVLILEHSKATAEKIVKTLRNIEKIGDILYAPTFDKPVNLLLSNRIDVLICGIELTEENAEKLNKLRGVCTRFFFIALSGDGKPGYTKKNPSLSVDYFLNSRKELEKLPAIIFQAAHVSNNISGSYQS
jgi:DNA-binding NarL/FixJ family response regulator